MYKIRFCKYLQHLYQGPMMIFGADVTHPAPGENSESIAAVTGSLDKECCFYGKIWNDKKIVDFFDEMSINLFFFVKAEGCTHRKLPKANRTKWYTTWIKCSSACSDKITKKIRSTRSELCFSETAFPKDNLIS